MTIENDVTANTCEDNNMGKTPKAPSDVVETRDEELKNSW